MHNIPHILVIIVQQNTTPSIARVWLPSRRKPVAVDSTLGTRRSSRAVALARTDDVVVVDRWRAGASRVAAATRMSKQAQHMRRIVKLLAG